MRNKPNRHVKYRQPKGYYEQGLDGRHRHPRSMRVRGMESTVYTFAQAGINA